MEVELFEIEFIVGFEFEILESAHVSSFNFDVQAKYGLKEEGEELLLSNSRLVRVFPLPSSSSSSLHMLSKFVDCFISANCSSSY